MSITILFAALAMLAMVHAAPVQEEQNNLQGLLDVLADQKTKESTAKTAGSNIMKQQQGGDDDGSMQELQGLLKSLANVQQDDDNSANAQFNWHSIARGALGLAAKHYANQQQDDDGSQADAQFFKSLLKYYANVQQDDDNSANAQFNWHSIARGALGLAAKHYANQQQDDDGSQADSQFWGSLLKRGLKFGLKHYADVQQDDNGSQAEAQFWGFLARHALGYAIHKLG